MCLESWAAVSAGTWFSKRPVGPNSEEGDSPARSGWAFIRAATRADWVRGRRDFDHPTWHYINYPIIEAGSGFKAADHEPPAKRENVVNQLAVWFDSRSYLGRTRFVSHINRGGISRERRKK